MCARENPVGGYNDNCINYSYTALQLQMQLQIILCTTLYTTLHPHPAVAVEVTTATTPKSTTPTTFRSINGFALASMHHINSPLLVSYLWNFRHRLVRYYWYVHIFSRYHQYSSGMWKKKRTSLAKHPIFLVILVKSGPRLCSGSIL